MTCSATHILKKHLDVGWVGDAAKQEDEQMTMWASATLHHLHSLPTV